MGQAASISKKEQTLLTSKSAPAMLIDSSAQGKDLPSGQHSDKEIPSKNISSASKDHYKKDTEDDEKLAKAETVLNEEEDNDDSSVSSSSSDDKSFTSLPSRSIRKMSLGDFLSRNRPTNKEGENEMVFNPDSDQITVGDVVRVILFDPKQPKEGIVVEKVNKFKLKIDFGDQLRECLIENCAILVRSNEFEVGDKVEARPGNSSLFFVGKVLQIHDDKSMDILMDGDDPDDIEYSIPPENARKLMSRRSLVVNRWRKAFMLVVAANFFKRIHFEKEEK
eukprot:gene5443-5991_t